MKQATVCTILLLAVCYGAYAQQTTTETATGKSEKMKREKGKMKGDGMMQPMDLPYTATYSSQFRMGNPAYTKTILEMHRGYEQNDFSKSDVFADTVTVMLPDGQVLQGRDAVMNGFKQGRAGVSSSQFTISAVLPTHSIDRNEDWVAVWGSQQFTTANDNTQGGVQYHSIWRFNKDGKIDYVQFYEGKTPAQQ